MVVQHILEILTHDKITDSLRLRLGKLRFSSIYVRTRFSAGAPITPPIEAVVPVEINALISVTGWLAVLPVHAAAIGLDGFIVDITVRIDNRDEPHLSVVHQIRNIGVNSVIFTEIINEVNEVHHTQRLPGVSNAGIQNLRFILTLILIYIVGYLHRPDIPPFHRLTDTLFL